MSTCPGCDKGDRALLYCHRGDCPRLVGAKVDVPQPDVTVTSDAAGVNVVIARDGKCTTHRGEASTRDGQVKSVVDKILADHRTAEYVKRA